MTRPAAALAALLVLAAARAVAIDRATTLDGPWLFQPDPDAVGEAQGWEKPEADRSGWRRVSVPMSWDHYDPTMEDYEGVAWYALAIPAERVVPPSWQRLRFGRVNHKARAWLNGRLVGENLTGYLPFELPATPYLVAGRTNWLVLRVENGTRYDWLPGTPIVEWVQYGGILEPVELLTTYPVYVGHVGVLATPRGADGHVVVSVEVANASDAPFTGRVRVGAAGKSSEEALEVAAGATGRVAVPLVLPGVNRYDEFPGRGPVVDEATTRKDLLAVKESGANLVRVHYPQSPAHLRIADEIGLLVMEEVPLNWWRASWHPKVPPEHENDRIVDVAERALEQMVRRDGSHPSVVISEFGTVGVPGWGGPLRSSEDLQAAYVAAVWKAMSSVPDVAGGVVWSWADYRHRRGFTNGFPTEFGLFGLVTLDRRPKKAHAAMRGLWRAESE